mmetsp:Transcript_15066/g.41904  ORF Transcript_15066/g.41904 Transcript_15066/m.41904 type:complete len:147 (-) Transcript_15066:266-706(-)
MNASSIEKAECAKSDLRCSDGGATCHMLPCNVDFEGMAKTHVFFKPAEVEEGVFASTFRGRGLLATQQKEGTGGSSSTDTEYHSYLLSLEENKIRVKSSVRDVVEWHHEHSVKSLKYKESDSSRLQIAKEWMEISDALHEPLPLGQ